MKVSVCRYKVVLEEPERPLTLPRNAKASVTGDDRISKLECNDDVKLNSKHGPYSILTLFMEMDDGKKKRNFSPFSSCSYTTLPPTVSTSHGHSSC